MFNNINIKILPPLITYRKNCKINKNKYVFNNIFEYIGYTHDSNQGLLKTYILNLNFCVLFYVVPRYCYGSTDIYIWVYYNEIGVIFFLILVQESDKSGVIELLPWTWYTNNYSGGKNQMTSCDPNFFVKKCRQKSKKSISGVRNDKTMTRETAIDKKYAAEWVSSRLSIG